MQQRGGQLAAHALPERELLDRNRQVLAQLEQLHELVEVEAEIGFIEPVDGLVELEGLICRNLPPQLGSLPHHERDRALEGGLALPRDMAQGRRRARGRGQ